MGATASSPARESFTLDLERDCGLAVVDAPIQTVEVRQSGHPTAAGRVAVRAAGDTWRFTLTHEGDLEATERVLADGSKRQIAVVPDWLERVLASAGYEDLQ
jgi:hypothetical protein